MTGEGERSYVPSAFAPPLTDDLLVYNIGELATLEGGVRYGRAMRDLGIRRNAAILIQDGFVEEIGESEALWKEHRRDVPLLNAQGRCVTPGFVDPHTHAVFAGDRVNEFERKLEGATYADILREGGGILHTVRLTREATRAELLKELMMRLDRMVEHGTTTVEIKTGYGLDLETEKRLLDVCREAEERHPVEVVRTLMPAHAKPPEFASASEFAAHVSEKIIPALADEAEFVDVFCEEGVFSVDDSRRVLAAGIGHGLVPKIHADELARSGGSRLAAELGTRSADHLLHASPEDVAGLVKAGVTPVLLPGTALSLSAAFANARGMIDAGAPVAIATDYNPNCPSESMPMAMALACYGMRMTPAEALTAATINAAAAIGRDEDRGSLEEGKQGDLVLFEAPSHAHVPYRFGVNLVWKVVKLGEVVVDHSDRRL